MRIPSRIRTPGLLVNLALATVALALVVGAGTSAASPQFRLAAAEGSLSLSNSRDGQAVFRAEAMRPGEEASGSVRIVNTGTVAGALRVAPAGAAVDVPGIGGGRLSARLELLVIDVTNVQAPVTVYAGRLSAMGSTALGSTAPGEQRTFLFVATLPPGGPADNAYQGAQLAAGFTWTATGSAVATTTPTPTPTPGGGTGGGSGSGTASGGSSQPPAVTPPPPGSSVPPATGATLGDQVFNMPATTACASRRKFPIRVRRPKGVAFKKLTITVNGRAKVKVGGLKARKLKATVNLRGLPKGKVVVKLVAVTSTGGKLTSTRTYRTCAAKKTKKKAKARKRR